MTIQNIDWNAVWKSQVTANSEARGGFDRGNVSESEAWARNYWKMVLDARDFVQQMQKGLPIHANTRILDIGAGPGTLTVPLAKQTARITSVEPAGSMAEILRENIKAHGLNNVECIQKKWEDIDEGQDLEPPYDLVIASFSLGMADIRAAIEKMQRVSNGYIFLFWFAGPSSWDRDFGTIYKTLFDKEYPGMPQGNVLFNVLYQMGVYPNLEVFPSRMDHHYSSVEDLVGDIRSRLPEISVEQTAMLNSYYANVVEKRENGVVFPYTWQSMKIWWKKG